MTDPTRRAAYRLVLALQLEDQLGNDPLITDALSLARRTLSAIETARQAQEQQERGRVAASKGNP